MARKILLADDSVTAQNMGRKILADAGYEVIAVNNGSAALKKIAELKPDLVILDVYMPGYSGLEVCQRLKESGETARIPVLLTVGKLEPFKPEEAQRVRAEGFIVKPFEASELLSALSKLEDKVVPRAEPTKPGRFARAIAAAEEAGRGNRNETAAEEGGWKSRIGFPQKKTEAEEKVADEVSTYNPVNRDLRTVVETEAEKSAEKALALDEQRRRESRPAESSVDMAALAPPGLPKDVTPEEVAAIAAAAAQLQIAGNAIKDEPPASGAVENNFSQPPDSQDGSIALMKPEASTEPLPDSKDDKEEPKIESVAAAPAHNRRKDDQKSQEPQDIPMTMAATAESATPTNPGSRWTAVAVALEGDEATLSLEEEMRQAYAGFAKADTESATVNPAPVENSSAPTLAEENLTAALSNAEREPVGQSQPAMNAEVTEIAPMPVAQPVAESTFVAADVVAQNFEPVNFAANAQPANEQPGNAQLSVVEPPSETAPEVASAASGVTEPDQPVPSAQAVSPFTETQVPGTGDDAPPEVKEPQPMPEPEATAVHAFAPIVRDNEPAEEPKLDSETVKSTAAAWASWRQIRDTGKEAAQTQHEEAAPKEFDVPESAPVQTAARAAAAGAEKMQGSPSASSESDPSAIANIVDSVLADLRPKLMEEISRKMAEKK